jgi:hypothetical protein
MSQKRTVRLTTLFSKAFIIFLPLTATHCGQWTDDSNSEQDETVGETRREGPQGVHTQETPPPSQATNTSTSSQENPPSSSTPSSLNEDDLPHDADATNADGIIVHEGGLSTDFTQWMSDKKNEGLLSQLGRMTENGGVLELTSDATFSFSSFAKEQPLLIRTNGHNLTLLGADFSYLKIDSSKKQDNSGHVRIYSTAFSLPAINTSAEHGQPGSNGSCLTQKTCVPVSDTQTKDPLNAANVEWVSREEQKWWNWDDQAIPGSWRSTIFTEVPSEAGAAAQSHCGSDGVAGQVHVEGPFINGRFNHLQTLEHPVSAAQTAQPRPQDAQLFPGQPGAPGFNAGRIMVYQWGDENKDWIDKVQYLPGLGGLGGLHFKTVPTQETPDRQFRTRKRTERFLVNELKVEWEVAFTCSSSEPLRRRNYRFRTSGRFKKTDIPVSTDAFISTHSVSIQGTPAGRDLAPNADARATSGNNGQPGELRVQKLKSIRELKSKIHPQIPLPRAFTSE